VQIKFHTLRAMIYLGGKAKSIEEGYKISTELVKTGKAFEKFVEMVKAQGGDTKYLYTPENYPLTQYRAR